MQIRVKNESPCNMNTSIRHNCVLALETVCYTEVLSILYVAACNIDFINAILKQSRQSTLNQLQVAIGSANFTVPAMLFRYR